MPMTMYEIAFPVTINIGAWAVVYVRQIGQIADSGLGAPGKDFSWPLQTKIFPIPLERPYLAGIAVDAARQTPPGECVITSDTNDCMRCKKIAKAGYVPAFFR